MSTPSPCTISVERTPPALSAVVVDGELDLATSPELARVADAELAQAPATLVLDLSACAFADSAAVAVLVRLHTDAEAKGIRVAVVATPGGPVRRVLELTGLDARLVVADTRDDAAAGSGVA